MRASALFFIFIYLLSPAAARAGAWLCPEGHGQLILTTAFADARGAFDASGRLVATPSYRKFESRFYLEHGVTDWLSLIAEGGAMRFQGGGELAQLTQLDALIAEAKGGLPLILPAETGIKYQGLGLGAAGARLQLFALGDYVFSVETSLRAASHEARSFLDMRSPTQFDARLPMGRSLSLFGFTGFLDAQIGYRTRGQNGDEIRMDFTAGFRAVDRLMLMAQSFSAVAPRGGLSTFMAAQKFQLSVVYELTPAISTQIGAVTALSGVNAPAEHGLIGAVWWRY